MIGLAEIAEAVFGGRLLGRLFGQHAAAVAEHGPPGKALRIGNAGAARVIERLNQNDIVFGDSGVADGDKAVVHRCSKWFENGNGRSFARSKIQSSAYILNALAGASDCFAGDRSGFRRFARAARSRSFAVRTARSFPFRKLRIIAAASMPFIEPRTAAMSAA